MVSGYLCRSHISVIERIRGPPVFTGAEPDCGDCAEARAGLRDADVYDSSDNQEKSEVRAEKSRAGSSSDGSSHTLF